MKKIILLVVSILLITIIAYFTMRRVEPVTANTFVLDTICEITIYDMEEMTTEKASTIISESFDLCREYENILSKTLEASDIYKLNNAKGSFVNIDKEALYIIEKSIEISKITKGAFDITIGEVSDLWDFTASTPDLPSAEEISDKVSSVGYENIIIENNEIRLSNSDTKVDLGGIAKGYIADRVGELLTDKGVTSAIINLGGNVVALGEKEKDEGFTIGVERPYSDRSEIIGSLNLADQTVVVAGIYQRNFVLDGMLYHHILDTRTGYPVKNTLEAVVIIASKGDSMMCDALSTACIALGVDEGKKLIETMDGFEAIFIEEGDKITMTEGVVFNPVGQ